MRYSPYPAATCMQLTSFTDYSLRVLIYLALNPERGIRSAEIARAFGISRHHLLKVIRELAKSGLVQTTRGSGGGLRLTREPGEIRIGALVRRMEPGSPLLECFDLATNTCPIVPACGLKRVLGRAFQAFHAVLDEYTLADFATRPETLRALLADAPARKNPAKRYPARPRTVGSPRRSAP